MSYYRKFQTLVDYKAQAVRQVLADLPMEISNLSKEHLLEAVVERFKGFGYMYYTGWKPFETVLQKQKGNCLTLSCFLCSALRALQFTEEEVFVCVFQEYDGGNIMNQMLAPLSHAVVIIQFSSTILCIQPTNMQIWNLKTMNLEDIGFEANQRLDLFLFNDCRCRFFSKLRIDALNKLIASNVRV
jgi:hypothetical protein